MKNGTITGTVTTPVVLGQGNYGAQLTIAASGSVYPANSTDAAITGPAGLAGVVIDNMGSIAGGNSSSMDTGGAGIVLNDGGRVTNSGAIVGGLSSYAGAGGIGVDMSAGTLRNAGTIGGGAGGNAQYFNGGNGGFGVSLQGAGRIVNTGVIRGGAGGMVVFTMGYRGGSGGTGVYLAAGTLVNAAGGQIIGGIGGNAYSVGGFGGGGVDAKNGATIANAGTIAGGSPGIGNFGGYGIDFRGTGTLVNSGVVRGNYGGGGVYLSSGLVTNTGTIAGGSGIYSSVGVFLDGGTLVARAGLIAGGGPAGTRGDAVQFGNGGAGTLVVSPGAVFQGDIVADTQVADTLDLVGSTAGTLTGLGSTVTGFTTIREESGATWRLDGTLAGVRAAGIDTNATLQFYGAATTTRIAFGQAGHATLLLGNPAQVGSTFSGFGTGDKIDLVGVAATSLRYAGGTLTLFGSGGHVVDTLHFAGSYTQADFALQSFAKGTAVVYAGSAAETLSGHFGGGVVWLDHGLATAAV